MGYRKVRVKAGCERTGVGGEGYVRGSELQGEEGVEDDVDVFWGSLNLAFSPRKNNTVRIV